MSAKNNETNKQFKNTIPTTNERLAYLRPSRELLEYYRQKIGEYDVEKEEMLRKLDSLKQIFDDQNKLQWELRQKDDEIAELQKAVSDMQVFLFQEREQVLKLYAENDRLKIRELQDRKKINRLLSLAGVNEQEITYFVKEPPGMLIIEQMNEQKKSISSKEPVGKSNPEKNAPLDYESLLLYIKSLETQITEQAKHLREEFDGLLEDRKTRIDEFDAQRIKDAQMIKELREKLLQCQKLLHESTKEFLDLKFSYRQNERNWMNEKDRLLSELDKSSKHKHIKDDEIIFVAQETTACFTEEEKRNYENTIKDLKEEIKQMQNLAEMYKSQVLQLEDRVAKKMEEGDITRELFKGREEKLYQRLKLCSERYKELEKRRNIEIEGFKNELKQLRDKLRTLERSFYKVSASVDKKGLDVTIARTIDGGDDAIKNLYETTQRSRQMQGELHHLKAKIYSIENDIKML